MHQIFASRGQPGPDYTIRPSTDALVNSANPAKGAKDTSFEALLSIEKSQDADRQQIEKQTRADRADRAERAKDEDEDNTDDTDDDTEAAAGAEPSATPNIALSNQMEKALDAQTGDEDKPGQQDLTALAAAAAKEGLASGGAEAELTQAAPASETEKSAALPGIPGVDPDAAPVEAALALKPEIAAASSSRGYNPFAKPGETNTSKAEGTAGQTASAQQPATSPDRPQAQPQGDGQPSDFLKQMAHQGIHLKPGDMPAGLQSMPGFGDMMQTPAGGPSAAAGASGTDLSVQAAGAPAAGSSLSDISTVTLRSPTASARPQLPTPDIAAQITKHAEAGINRFQIRLDPPEMGRIDVRIEIGDRGQLSAHLSADRQDTLDLLQRDAKTLEKALQALGMDADQDNLQFSLRQDAGGSRGKSSFAAARCAPDAGAAQAVTIDPGTLPPPVYFGAAQHINLVV